MSRNSPADVRVLHAVRTLGYADTSRIATHVHEFQEEVREHLMDAQAHGWVVFTSFAGDGGWSLTESGKAHGERQLAVELDELGARATVEAAYEDFLLHNDAVAAACTAWQLTELGIGERHPTLSDTIVALDIPSAALAVIEHRLTTYLGRFTGYHHRFEAALTMARAEPAWITGTDRDSCHRVWFELHEDFIATLGLTR